MHEVLSTIFHNKLESYIAVGERLFKSSVGNVTIPNVSLIVVSGSILFVAQCWTKPP